MQMNGVRIERERNGEVQTSVMSPRHSTAIPTPTSTTTQTNGFSPVSGNLDQTTMIGSALDLDDVDHVGGGGGPSPANGGASSSGGDGSQIGLMSKMSTPTTMTTEVGNGGV